MKWNENFMLRQVAGETLVIPVGEAAMNIKGLIGMSESGALLLQRVHGGADREELVRALVEHYDVTAETARADVDAFLEQMTHIGMLLEA